MNASNNKLVIALLSLIVIMLAVLGYLFWNMNKEPMPEVSVMEQIPTPAPVIPKPVEEVVKKQELPDYPITKVDATSWKSRETKLGNVGLKYKTIPLNANTSTSLNPYGIAGLPSLWSNRSADDIKLGKDIIFVTDCDGPCGGTPSNFIKVQIIDDKQSTTTSLTDLFSKDSCEYDIIDSGEADGMSYRYNAQSKCNNKPNYDAQQLPPLCVAGSEIKKYRNPFVAQSASDLIQCKVVSNAKSVDDSSSKPVLNLVDRELFIVDLGNSKLAVVSHQLANNPEYDSSIKQKINNLMHTILSTIEVL